MIKIRPPRSISPYFSLDSPFTSQSLANIRLALTSGPPLEVLSDPPSVRKAAVLVPLCNVDGRPSILYEIRGKLRTHSGEVSFPGGKLDETDDSLVGAALRETHEETGILPSQVEVLGQLSQPVFSLGGLRVYPYVGFIHSQPQRAERDNGAAEFSPTSESPLPSIHLSALTPSPTEVIHIFRKSFRDLIQVERLREHAFRAGDPYYAIDVTDEVEGRDIEWSAATGVDEVGGSGQVGKLEIWGLTGWYTNTLLEKLGLLGGT